MNFQLRSGKNIEIYKLSSRHNRKWYTNEKWNGILSENKAHQKMETIIKHFFRAIK